MIFIKFGQVIMSAAMNSYKRDPARAYGLQTLAMPDRYQPVARAMNDIGMAIYFTDPPVCA